MPRLGKPTASTLHSVGVYNIIEKYVLVQPFLCCSLFAQVRKMNVIFMPDVTERI